MKKTIESILQFPVDAQSNGLICAFVSAILVADKYDENTPFYCGQKRSVCLNCGNCANKSIMVKHHCGAYHDYVTLSGIGLLWGDSDPCGTYEIPCKKNLPADNLSDRVDCMFKIAGYDYARYMQADGKDKVFEQIKASIDMDMPVLIKLGNGNDWSVVTGYDTENQMLLGIDAHKHFCIEVSVKPDGYTENDLFYTSSWFENLSCAIVITKKTSKLPFDDLIERMILILGRKENAELETKVMAELDTGNGNRQKLAEWLNNLAGYSVECRWHAAECATAKIYHLTDNARIKQLLSEITSQYLLFHDLCWKIWGLLGVGPETNYSLSPDAGERLMKTEVINELKELFLKLFRIDRAVLEALTEIRSATAEGGSQ